jgi:hypothetical protein
MFGKWLSQAITDSLCDRNRIPLAIRKRVANNPEQSTHSPIARSANQVDRGSSSSSALCQISRSRSSQ